jgi:hypothetical protein
VQFSGFLLALLVSLRHRRPPARAESAAS